MLLLLVVVTIIIIIDIVVVIFVTAHLFCILLVFHFVLPMSETPYSLLSLVRISFLLDVFQLLTLCAVMWIIFRKSLYFIDSALICNYFNQLI